MRRDSHSAAALHARMRAATLTARSEASTASALTRPARRRLGSAPPWARLQGLRISRGTVDRTLSMDAALRRILAALLERATGASERVTLEGIDGPILVVRSGPWPVLQALLARLAASASRQSITVLCHRRDESTLNELSRLLDLDIQTLLYPRFEPFNTTTLRGLLRPATWGTTLVLDASIAGQGESLQHVMEALPGGEVYVWNADSVAWRQRPLRQRLSREEYALVRGLLRWSVRQAGS